MSSRRRLVIIALLAWAAVWALGSGTWLIPMLSIVAAALVALLPAGTA